MAAYAYGIFISYHHRSSGKAALALERALRRYAKPLFRPPMRVFRDEGQIAAGQPLKETIKSALEKSEYLVYIATREAAESPYVSEELDIWCRQLKRQDRLIIVWQKGKLADDPDSNSLLWQHTNVIPSSLKSYIEGIPIWVDLTWATSDEDLSLRNPRYKTLINSIIARVRNIPPEELIGEEIRIFRRNLRIRNGGVASLVLLLITATAAAGFGWWQLSKARSTILMNQSDNILAQDQTLALQFANEAYTTVMGKPSAVLGDTLLKAYYHEGFNFSTNYIQKLRHKEGLTTATFSPTGDMIVTGSVYGRITVWSPDGARLSSFAAQRFNILSADISADQTQIVTTAYMDADNRGSAVKLWSIDGKHIDTLYGPPSEYAFAEFAPNDNGILARFGASYGCRSVKFWEPGKPPIELIANQRANAVAAAFSSDGQYIGIAYDKGFLEMWNRAGEKVDTYRLGPDKAHFSTGGQLVVATSNNEVTCFDLNERRVIKRFKPNGFIIDAAISSPDANHILTRHQDGTIAIWTTSGKMRSAFKLQAKEVDFVGTGDRVFVTTGLNRGSLWDLDGRLLNTFAGHSKPISAAAISPDDRLLLTASGDGTVVLWPMESDAITLCDAEIPEVADFDIFPANDDLLLYVDTEQRAHFRDRRPNRPTSDLEKEKDIQSLFFSPQGERIVTVHSQSNDLKFWGQRGQFLKTCCQHPDPIIKAEFSPDGGLIETLSESIDDSVKLWTAHGERFEIPGIAGQSVERIIFAPDAKRIFVKTRSQAFVFDRDTNKITLDMTKLAFNATGVRFSPDGQSLLVASQKEIKIYDLEAPHDPLVIEDNDISASHIKWLPNGEGFFAASAGGQVGVWDRHGKRRYRWQVLGEGGYFRPQPSPDSANLFNTETGEIYNLQGVRLNTIDRDRFVTYLPDGAYLLSVLESQERERPDKLHLRDRYGNVVVSLGAIKGAIRETKMSADAKLMAVRTDDNNLVLRCTPEGIVDELAQTQWYTPDTFDRLKYGIDW